MANGSKIEWTELTWNPTTGCSKISAGCKNCYAEIFSKRLRAMKTQGYENGFQLTLHEYRLEQPLKRKKPTYFFVNSMSDLFHEEIPDAFIDRIFDIIKQTPHHTYQILTKRAYRLPEYFSSRKCFSNVWLGVTVEDNSTKCRIDYLRNITAPVRFVSAEPLLEDLGRLNLKNINWVIVGGESGVRARPMQHKWIESIKKQCHEKAISFFFKQWGGWGVDGKKRTKKNNGRVFNGQVWNEIPYLREKNNNF